MILMQKLPFYHEPSRGQPMQPLQNPLPCFSKRLKQRSVVAGVKVLVDLRPAATMASQLRYGIRQ